MIKIGIITGTIGTSGSIYVDDTPKSVKSIKIESQVLIGFSENFSQAYHIAQIAKKNNGLAIKFKEVSSREDANKLKENAVFVNEPDIIKKSVISYLPEEIKNCTVYNFKTGEKLGKLIDEINLPSNDVWVIDYHGNDVLIPVVEEIVRKVNLKINRIEINVIPGLLEANLNNKNYDDE